MEKTAISHGFRSIIEHPATLAVREGRPSGVTVLWSCSITQKICGEFLAAAVSASNRFLFVAADDGKCVVFDIATGEVEKIMPSFAAECSGGGSESGCEMSGLVCHPQRGFIGGYSNDKGQKRGLLTLWK